MVSLAACDTQLCVVVEPGPHFLAELDLFFSFFEVHVSPSCV
jgi:hypothetical protein